jgi:hypothetical protein
MENPYFASTLYAPGLPLGKTRKRFCLSANYVIIQRGSKRPVRTGLQGSSPGSGVQGAKVRERMDGIIDGKCKR